MARVVFQLLERMVNVPKEGEKNVQGSRFISGGVRSHGAATHVLVLADDIVRRERSGQVNVTVAAICG